MTIWLKMVSDDAELDSALPSKGSPSFRMEVLKAVIAQQCKDVGWHAVTESSLNALSEVLDRYLKKMSMKLAGYAELAGRNEATVDDFRCAFRDHEPSSSLKDLSNFIVNCKTSSMNLDILATQMPAGSGIQGYPFALESKPELANDIDISDGVISPHPDWMDDDLIFPPLEDPTKKRTSIDADTLVEERDKKTDVPNVEIIIADADEDVSPVEPPLGCIVTSSKTPRSPTQDVVGAAWPRQLSALSVVDGQVVERQPAKSWSSRIVMEPMKFPKRPIDQHMDISSGKPKKKKLKAVPEVKKVDLPPLFEIPQVTPSRISSKKSKKSKLPISTSSGPYSPTQTVVTPTPPTVISVKDGTPPDRKEPENQAVYQEPLMIKIKPLKMPAMFGMESPRSPIVESKDKSSRKEAKRSKKSAERHVVDSVMPPESRIQKSTKLDDAIDFLHTKKRKTVDAEPNVLPFLKQTPELPVKKSKIHHNEQPPGFMDIRASGSGRSSGKSGKSHSSHGSSKSHQSSRSTADVQKPVKIKEERNVYPDIPVPRSFMDISAREQKPVVASLPPLPKLTLKFGGKDIVSTMKHSASHLPEQSYSIIPTPSHSQRAFPDHVRQQQQQLSYSSQHPASPAPLDLSMGSRSSKAAHRDSGSRSSFVIKTEPSSSKSKARAPASEKKKSAPVVPIRLPTPPPPTPPPVILQPLPNEIPPVPADAPENWICPECGKMDDGSGTEMVACDDCDYWYHYNCVGLLAAPTVENWYCPKCLDKRMAKAKKNKKKR